MFGTELALYIGENQTNIRMDHGEVGDDNHNALPRQGPSRSLISCAFKDCVVQAGCGDDKERKHNRTAIS